MVVVTTTASAARGSAPAPACAACRTASPRSTGRCSSRQPRGRRHAPARPDPCGADALVAEAREVHLSWRPPPARPPDDPREPPSMTVSADRPDRPPAGPGRAHDVRRAPGDDRRQPRARRPALARRRGLADVRRPRAHARRDRLDPPRDGPAARRRARAHAPQPGRVPRRRRRRDAARRDAVQPLPDLARRADRVRAERRRQPARRHRADVRGGGPRGRGRRRAGRRPGRARPAATRASTSTRAPAR